MSTYRNDLIFIIIVYYWRASLNTNTRYHYFYMNKIQKLSSFKSNENIHKREDGSYYVVSANKASSVTL